MHGNSCAYSGLGPGKPQQGYRASVEVSGEVFGEVLSLIYEQYDACWL